MDIPAWDVDNASETLNKQLFGSGKKSKVQSKISLKKTGKNKSTLHLKSSSSENVNSNRGSFISKVKGKFGKKKTGQEDDIKDSSLSEIKSVKKKKKKKPYQVTNRLQTETSFPHEVANKTKLTLHMPTGNQTEVCEPTSELNAFLVSKTKKSRGKLNKLTSRRGLPNLQSKRKRKFVLPTNEGNDEVENYRPLKSNKQPSNSPQPNNDECVFTAGEKRKRKKWNENENKEESFTNTAGQSTQNKGDESIASGVVSSSNQIKKTKHNKPSKEKLKSINGQPKSTSTIVLKDMKILSRRQPGTLRERMLKRLQASRFRYLNEQMYCSKGDEAFEYFKTDPQAFQAYHHGYRQQVAKWPLNPLTTIISSLRKKSPALVIADFGCGDATLARSLPNTVHSFDLVAVSDEVTVCDMAHTPLKSSSVDVAVFCLSLMGTNLTDYLLEANRILKTGGLMKMAEVESRFENVADFIKTLMKYGFTIVRKDLSHNLFYFMDFQKVDNIKKGKKSTCPPVTLKPCLYKKR